MNYFFFHQTFPGQYRLLVRALAEDCKNKVYFITQPSPIEIPGVTKVCYDRPDISRLHLHTMTAELDYNILTGLAVAETCTRLREEGTRPDIMIGHGGWGETLFLKDVFPNVPLLTYFEFYYHQHGVDSDFDPEYQSAFDDPKRLRIKNATIQMAYDATDWGNSPTEWQRSLHPPEMRHRISVIHEGIDTSIVKPNPKARVVVPGRNITLSRNEQVVTFVARNLEPYRGFHIFMRSLPEIQRRNPDVQVLIVGGDGVSYGVPPPPGTCFRELLLTELEGQLDLSRIHFMGKLEYADYLKVLQISSAHIYLTYPFVLSWSFVEAMAAGCLIIGSSTPPVQEVIKNEINGLLVNFFDTNEIAETVSASLRNKKKSAVLTKNSLHTSKALFSFRDVTFSKWLNILTGLTD